MRSRTAIWTVALLGCAAALAGVALLWHWKGTSIGISVGLPAGVTLMTSIIAWAASVRPAADQTTSDQVQRARQALADHTLERLRDGADQPAGLSPALPASFTTLGVRWLVSPLSPAGDVASGRADGAAALADRLARGHARRLIILGEHGCGKTTLARQLMTELIGHPRHGDQVPVLFSFATWDVEHCSLADWMHQQIREAAPELRSKSSYGPDVVSALIRQEKILPVFDGLDTLPKADRRSVLTSDEFLLPGRVVLTSRTDEFRVAAAGLPLAAAVAVTPGRVSLDQARAFLGRTTDGPERWDPVFAEARANPHGSLAQALARPRILYLASTVYRGDGSDPGELIASQPFVEEHLIGALLPASLAAGQAWAASPPWYRARARGWLAYLARNVRDPDTGELAWGSVFRAVEGFYRWQSVLRALVGAVLAWVVVSLVYLGPHGLDVYGTMTGLAYAFAIASACLFLTPHRPDKVEPPLPAPDASPWRWWGWWIRSSWRKSWRIAGASAVTFVLYGITLGARAAIMGSKGSPWLEGFSEGLVAALVVALGALIAGIPAPPRCGPLAPHSDAEVPRTRTGARRRGPVRWRDMVLDGRPAGRGRSAVGKSVKLALSLGVLLGLVAAVLALVKHHASGLSVERSFSYGLIMGLNFGVGAWLVGWLRQWLYREGQAGPWAALRAERLFALLAALILGLTFASAFGLSADLRWTHSGAISDGLIGVIAGSLASEWPLYAVAVTIIALRRRQAPLRLMRFLEMCHQLGVLRPVRASYVFAEDPAYMGLTPKPPPPAAASKVVSLPVTQAVPKGVASATAAAPDG